MAKKKEVKKRYGILENPWRRERRQMCKALGVTNKRLRYIEKMLKPGKRKTVIFPELRGVI